MAASTAKDYEGNRFEAKIDLDGGPRGTATLSLRMDGSFLTARFPLEVESLPESDRIAAAKDAARKWLSEAASVI